MTWVKPRLRRPPTRDHDEHAISNSPPFPKCQIRTLQRLHHVDGDDRPEVLVGIAQRVGRALGHIRSNRIADNQVDQTFATNQQQRFVGGIAIGARKLSDRARLHYCVVHVRCRYESKRCLEKRHVRRVSLEGTEDL